MLIRKPHSMRSSALNTSEVQRVLFRNCVTELSALKMSVHIGHFLETHVYGGVQFLRAYVCRRKGQTKGYIEEFFHCCIVDANFTALVTMSSATLFFCLRPKSSRWPLRSKIVILLVGVPKPAPSCRSEFNTIMSAFLRWSFPAMFSSSFWVSKREAHQHLARFFSFAQFGKDVGVFDEPNVRRFVLF